MCSEKNLLKHIVGSQEPSESYYSTPNFKLEELARTNRKTAKNRTYLKCQ